MDKSVSFKTLSDILINDSTEAYYAFIKTTFNLNEESFESYKRQINQFITNHNFRWKKKSKFRKNHFEKQYESWLQHIFVLRTPAPKRALKPLDQCSRRTKKRREMMNDAENGDTGSSSVN